MTNATLKRKPDAGNPHIRIDEGEVASYPPTAGRPEGVAMRGAKPRRGSLPMPRKRIAGRTPHPTGIISTELRFENGQALGQIVLPKGLGGVFVWKGREQVMVSGTNRIEVAVKQ